ncbi:unnamed protein product, partial [Prunus brigantina]
ECYPTIIPSTISAIFALLISLDEFLAQSPFEVVMVDVGRIQWCWKRNWRSFGGDGGREISDGVLGEGESAAGCCDGICEGCGGNNEDTMENWTRRKARSRAR